jgi:endonuclease YncB( thermonuclease family)
MLEEERDARKACLGIWSNYRVGLFFRLQNGGSD